MERRTALTAMVVPKRECLVIPTLECRALSRFSFSSSFVSLLRGAWNLSDSIAA